MINQALAWIVVGLFLVWVSWELIYGGGDHAHKDHNPASSFGGLGWFRGYWNDWRS